ncbi:RraA family protein [Winogradskya humida]|uniref:Putative 4-hydroxy-4-methyl-2-oxoglutarate aldolase n=1 Tax=Winogradskya humida TaxID=113566 RepID=A0ABQ4A046_9ACTN|nr:RraA family protein [Actinoplanes humidus]GIE24255.1 dimethylmenaquinone methyltransferase [Actinoplanes humidus]
MDTSLPSTTLADLLGVEQVMDLGVRALWGPVALTGPAYTVQCPPGDNLMLHAAIYRAAPGSVIVAESGDTTYALAGGNVCAVAQRNGVAGLVLDGVIRDIGEVRDATFPVFARGVVPIPGTKKQVGALQVPVRCGGVLVNPGDLVVADEDGVVVVPADRREQVLADARAKLAKEAAQSLDEWEADHRSRIGRALRDQGFSEA